MAPPSPPPSRIGELWAAAEDAHGQFVIRESKLRNELTNKAQLELARQLKQFRTSAIAFSNLLDILHDGKNNKISDEFVEKFKNCFDYYKGSTSLLRQKYSSPLFNRIFGLYSSHYRNRNSKYFDADFNANQILRQILKDTRPIRLIRSLEDGLSIFTDNHNNQFNIGRQSMIRSLTKINDDFSAAEFSELRFIISSNQIETLRLEYKKDKNSRNILEMLSAIKKIYSAYAYLNNPDTQNFVYSSSIKKFAECMKLNDISLPDMEILQKSADRMNYDFDRTKNNIKFALNLKDIGNIYDNSEFSAEENIVAFCEKIEKSMDDFYSALSVSTINSDNDYTTTFSFKSIVYEKEETIYISYPKADFDAAIHEIEATKKISFWAMIVSALTSSSATAFANFGGGIQFIVFAIQAALLVKLRGLGWLKLLRIYRKIQRNEIKEIIERKNGQLELVTDSGSIIINQKMKKAFYIFLKQIEEMHRKRK